jgi:hypothetical protein
MRQKYTWQRPWPNALKIDLANALAKYAQNTCAQCIGKMRSKYMGAMHCNGEIRREMHLDNTLVKCHQMSWPNN